ncbi:hypothetical protein B0I21_102227 [Sphingobacterium paludis]|uniref:Uncharacterized protein n=1 Tax=Sphingobacterium paludis TaxID=1476465 RepID=A0A4R7D4U9_9SPHI|nr:hypothetical protein B0I21_102227 [Sphingobacterium paludis]
MISAAKSSLILHEKSYLKRNVCFLIQERVGPASVEAGLSRKYNACTAEVNESYRSISDNASSLPYIWLAKTHCIGVP